MVLKILRSFTIDVCRSTYVYFGTYMWLTFESYFSLNRRISILPEFPNYNRSILLLVTFLAILASATGGGQQLFFSSSTCLPNERCHMYVQVRAPTLNCWHLAMPRAGASARAQEKVALQSEVMPEAKRSKRSFAARETAPRELHKRVQSKLRRPKNRLRRESAQSASHKRLQSELIKPKLFL